MTRTRRTEPRAAPLGQRRCHGGARPDGRRRARLGPAARARALVLLGLCLGVARPGGATAEDSDREILPTSAVSARRAFWTSLLVPGWGQIRAGRRAAGFRFLAVEAALWSGFAGWQHVAGIRRDTYRTFAGDHAGARTAGKGSAFWDDLGFYDSRLQHNQFARVDEGADAGLYPDGAEYFWEWDSQASRLRFRSLRNGAETAERNALYATGLVVANHLIAAIHAARAARAAGEADASGPVGQHRPQGRAWPVRLEVAAWPGRLDAALVHRF